MPEDRSAIAYTELQKPVFMMAARLQSMTSNIALKHCENSAAPIHAPHSSARDSRPYKKTDTSITFSFGEGYDQETALIVAKDACDFKKLTGKI